MITLKIDSGYFKYLYDPSIDNSFLNFNYSCIGLAVMPFAYAFVCAGFHIIFCVILFFIFWSIACFIFKTYILFSMTLFDFPTKKVMKHIKNRCVNIKTKDTKEENADNHQQDGSTIISNNNAESIKDGLKQTSSKSNNINISTEANHCENTMQLEGNASIEVEEINKDDIHTDDARKINDTEEDELLIYKSYTTKYKKEKLEEQEEAQCKKKEKLKIAYIYTKHVFEDFVAPKEMQLFEIYLSSYSNGDSLEGVIKIKTVNLHTADIYSYGSNILNHFDNNYGTKGDMAYFLKHVFERLDGIEYDSIYQNMTNRNGSKIKKRHNGL